MQIFLYPDLAHHLIEHYLNQLQVANTNIHNYNLGASYCRKSSFKGGICIFVHRNLNFTTIKLNAYCSDYNTEICAVKLHSILPHISILSIYIAPTGNIAHFLHTTDITLKFLHTSKIEFITCGDININCLTDTQRKNQLNSLLISYNPFHMAVNTTSALLDESDGALQTNKT